MVGAAVPATRLRSALDPQSVAREMHAGVRMEIPAPCWSPGGQGRVDLGHDARWDCVRFDACVLTCATNETPPNLRR